MTDNQNKIDMNDHYIRHKKAYFKLSIISGILFQNFPNTKHMPDLI